MKRFKVGWIGLECLAAVALLACASALVFGEAPLLVLSESVEANAFAGARCTVTPSEPCVVCAVLTECHIGGGGAGACQQVGRQDGCATFGTRRVCDGSWSYTVCVNNTGHANCGSSQTAPSCVIEEDNGIINKCEVPPNNTCGPPVTVDCQHCTESPRS